MCEGGLESLCLAGIDGHGWGVAVEVVVFLYCFAGLAIVCDDFLVISLETLCVRFNIREDIAGASFLAFGSAAPEIIINAVTTLQSVHSGSGGKDTTSLGIGAIMGSGLIAFSVIPGCCGLFALEELHLKRRPLLRDYAAYLSALVMLCIAFHDGVITLVESAIMVAMYFVYLTILGMSPKIRAWYRRRFLKKTFQKRKSFVIRNQEKRRLAAAIAAGSPLSSPLLDDDRQAEADAAAAAPRSMGSPDARRERSVRFRSDGDEEEEDAEAGRRHVRPSSSSGGSKVTPADAMARPGSDGGAEHKAGPPSSPPPPSLSPVRSEEDEDEDEEDSDNESMPRGSKDGIHALDDDAPEFTGAMGVLVKVLDGATRPLRWLFMLTCPPCHHDGPHARWYPVTFITSFVWVAVFSYIISAVVERWVDLSGVSFIVFGIVLVAVGAEIPDTVQSVTVARRGYGSMAVGNATGSQVINILIGLGLPWLLSNLSGRRVHVTDHKHLQTAAFFQAGNVVVSFVLLVGLAMAMRLNKARLYKRKGVVMLCAYVCAVGGYLLVSYED
eukprot:CAMPEP_0196770158 /NCGR_PEP_ID=MMETSP1104-20130614/971_1 /TAXON_ID=33652 /ORGANISM="Cafeteria sp., Strain Caron Lab Isolate" /LENGTH=554 /DNA_ID=CAMNT_0042140267 /DNA_START=124 /DNA_END=1788 /DNA_ORIENTATION=-